jgi:hypothetical protein
VVMARPERTRTPILPQNSTILPGVRAHSLLRLVIGTLGRGTLFGGKNGTVGQEGLKSFGKAVPVVSDGPRGQRRLLLLEGTSYTGSGLVPTTLKER